MTALAKRYGGSLYDLAAEEGLTARLLAELETAAAALKREPDYQRLLATPSVPLKERCGLLDAAFAAAHPYTVNFLKVLCEEGAIAELSGCLSAYRARYNEDNGIIEVTARTAVALTDAQREKLCAKLAALTGKTIRLTDTLDPSVLGGVRLDWGSTRLDGTVRSRLEALGEAIAGAVM